MNEFEMRLLLLYGLLIYVVVSLSLCEMRKGIEMASSGRDAAKSSLEVRLESCFDGVVSPNIPSPTPKDRSDFVCSTLDTTDQKYNLKLRLPLK